MPLQAGEVGEEAAPPNIEEHRNPMNNCEVLKMHHWYQLWLCSSCDYWTSASSLTELLSPTSTYSIAFTHPG